MQVGAVVAEPGLLHHIIGIGFVAQQPERQGPQVIPLRGKDVRLLLGVHRAKP